MKKLYCYVDETGQDTKGKIFLVSVVISGPFLRLADALAGFLRDYIEGKDYAKKISNKYKVFDFIQEIKK